MNRTLFDKDIDARFRRARRGAPGSSALFVLFCERLRGLGFSTATADAVLHQIRWHHHVEYADGLQRSTTISAAGTPASLMVAPRSSQTSFETRRIASSKSPIKRMQEAELTSYTRGGHDHPDNSRAVVGRAIERKGR